jgi:protein-disulfide isomerase
MIVSMILSVRGLYLFAVYGNCNGPQSDAFCVFDPQGFNKQSYLNFTLPDVKIMPDADDDPFLGSPDARVTIIEFGCYKCPYTAKAESAVDEILSYYGDDVKFVFRDFPVSNPHLGADINAEAANCAIEQGRFWEYHDKLFQSIQEGCQVPLNDTNIEPHIINLLQYATELGMDETRFRECLTSRRYKEEVSDDFADGINAGVRGTPTFFIGDQVIVGPKPFSTFRKIIDRGLKS